MKRERSLSFSSILSETLPPQVAITPRTPKTPKAATRYFVQQTSTHIDQRRHQTHPADEGEDELQSVHDEVMIDIKPHIPATPPTQKKKKSNVATPSTSPKKSKGTLEPGAGGSGGNASAKARMAEIIVEAGLAGFDKAFVEMETGLTKAQQTEMLKKGRGSMWKALMGFAATL